MEGDANAGDNYVPQAFYTGPCTPFSEALRETARNTEAMFLIHPTTMHFNGVIALRQRNNLTLIWCDSMQFDRGQDGRVVKAGALGVLMLSRGIEPGQILISNKSIGWAVGA